MSASKSDAVAALVAVILVQWFVVNLAVSLDTTAPVPQIDKVLHGFRTAVFLDILDHEAALMVGIGMLIFPALLAVEYIAGMLTRRVKRGAGHPVRPFPHSQVLKGNWVWLIYWPLWLWVYALVWPSLLVAYGGTFVIPPLVAAAIGARTVLRLAEPRLS